MQKSLFYSPLKKGDTGGFIFAQQIPLTPFAKEGIFLTFFVWRRTGFFSHKP